MRRCRFALIALVAIAMLAVPAATTASGAAAAGGSPAAAIVAAHVPAGGGGGGSGPAVLDVDAQAVLTVTTTADDGSAGSLRDVIENQANSGGGDTVVLADGATYVLTCGEGGTLTHGDSPLEIEGNGATITMDAACEEGILVNGTGALVIRDVQFTGLDLAPTTQLTAIVRTGGPFTLVGGRVADNTVDAGAQTLDGFFFATGAAAGALVVDGTVFAANDRSARFDCGLICAGTDVEIRNAAVADTTVAAGTSGGCGALACVSGDVDVVDSTITGSTSTGTSHCGGLICIDGTLTLTRTTVAATASTVAAPGSLCGGIVCTSGGMVVTDSSITGTTATGPADSQCGAGVLCGNDDLTLVRSTVAGTRVALTGAPGDDMCGTMLCTDGGLTAVNSTVADNVTTGGAGLVGAWTTGGPIGFTYVTFVGNAGSDLPALSPFAAETVDFEPFGSVLAGSGVGGTCSADVVVTSQGYNFADDTSCGLTGTGDVQQEGADPGLGALADNGGPGPTMLPADASPLVGAVPSTACAAGQGITNDERSLPRPSGLGPDCDVGAVELQPVPVIEPTFTG